MKKIYMAPDMEIEEIVTESLISESMGKYDDKTIDEYDALGKEIDDWDEDEE